MKIEQELDGLVLLPHHGQIVDRLTSKHLFYSVSIRTWLFTTDTVGVSKRTVLFKNQPSAFPGERWALAGFACLPACPMPGVVQALGTAGTGAQPGPGREQTARLGDSPLLEADEGIRFLQVQLTGKKISISWSVPAWLFFFSHLWDNP